MSDNGANPKEPHFYGAEYGGTIERDYDNSIENMGRKALSYRLAGHGQRSSNTPHPILRHHL